MEASLSGRPRGSITAMPRPRLENLITTLITLDRFYESYGVRDAMWIREVNEHSRYIIVLPPTYFIPIYTSGGEVQWPEWL
jgi:hypothetical protein